MQSPDELSKLSREALFFIAIHLDLPQILELCKSNKEIDQKLCKQDAIWNEKLKQLANNDIIEKIRSASKLNGKKLYILINSLNKIKKVFKPQYSIYGLYMTDELEFLNKQITMIPKEIGVLSNLQILNLAKNQITEIPKELGNLTNLFFLNLSNNKITEIPAELGNLKNLEDLDLSFNNILSIPKELGKLSKLKELNLYFNKITEIPEELKHLPIKHLPIRPTFK